MKKNGQYVGVDEKYIPEDEKYLDKEDNNEIIDMVNKGINTAKNYINDKDNQEKIKKTGKKGLKILKGISIGYLLFLGFITLMIIVIFVFVIINMFNTNKRVEDFKNNSNEMVDRMNDNINKEYNSREINLFNSELELFTGTQYGSRISSLLDIVVTKIKKNSSHLIEIVYKDATLSNPNDIIKLKDNFEDWTKYEVSFDYDAKGYINKVTIFDKK